MLYVLYLIGFFLAKVLPMRACYAIAGFVARIFYIFSKRDKEELKENLRVVLGEDTPKEVIDRHTREVFKNFAKYLADFFKFTVFTEEYIDKNIGIEGREHLDGALKEGKGVINLALHLGNWELGGAVVGGLKYPASAIVLEHKSKRVNDFFVKQRAINNFRSIPIGFQIKECFRALRRNEMVAIVGDKDYTSNGVYVDFFGKKALLPKGPAVVSLRTGAPIVFSVLTREKGDKFILHFEKPIKYTPTDDHEKDVRELMKIYIKFFEKYVRKYPDQWYVFRKVWNQD